LDRVKNLLQEGHTNRRNLKNYIHAHRCPELTIRKQATGENRALLGTRIKDVKDLGEDQRHERRRRGATQTIAFVPLPVRADREGEKRNSTQQQALPNNQT